jgi:hypothetical protein
MTAEQRQGSTDRNSGGTAAEREYEDYVLAERGAASDEPDVLLDAPVVKVDEINLEVEELRARVSLQAEVLDLLRLNVGADVLIRRVALEIKGVEAQALLKVRLDNVARILDRVLKTIDQNPEIVERITAGVGSAVDDVGGGAAKSLGELGEGAGEAVEDVGAAAGDVVADTGETAKRAAPGVTGTVGKATRGGGKPAGQRKDPAEKPPEPDFARRAGRTQGSGASKRASGRTSAGEGSSDG